MPRLGPEADPAGFPAQPWRMTGDGKSQQFPMLLQRGEMPPVLTDETMIMPSFKLRPDYVGRHRKDEIDVAED